MTCQTTGDNFSNLWADGVEGKESIVRVIDKATVRTVGHENITTTATADSSWLINVNTCCSINGSVNHTVTFAHRAIVDIRAVEHLVGISGGEEETTFIDCDSSIIWDVVLVQGNVCHDLVGG